jgi:hypothetical protein
MEPVRQSLHLVKILFWIYTSSSAVRCSAILSASSANFCTGPYGGTEASYKGEVVAQLAPILQMVLAC